MQGDKSRYINTGLDEIDTATYFCACGYEKDVAEEFDLACRMFFPVKFADTICPKCDDAMDRHVETVNMVSMRDAA
jgi:hypothetical protein